VAVELHASLDHPLPSELGVGRGTALFVAGTAYCPEASLRSLSLVVDGELQPVLAHGMPRLDFFRGLHPRLDPFQTGALREDPASAEDPLLLGYRSGFWGLASIAPGASDQVVVGLLATLPDGRELEAELGRVAVVSPPASSPARWPDRAAGPRVALCMATYNPPAELLERQLDSIRAQSHENWTCVISDDCSAPEQLARLHAAVGDDPRFVVSTSPRRLGFYRNFERALALAPADAEYVAMSDQDDAWYPDKLASLLAGIGRAQLVYSDARIVDRDGAVLADSYWGHRRNNHSDLLSLLVANAVTGAASLFRAEMLDDVLPFPPAQFAHFHDHWIGLVALGRGEISYLDRPLYDYVQHATASLGHDQATQMTSLGFRLAHQRNLPERVRLWRLHYFVDLCRLWQFATILQLRCGERMGRRKRRTLRRFLASDRSPLAVATLALRGLRELLGRRPETLGAEWMLAHALVWRWLLGASARPRPQRRLRLDAVPPPTLVMAPGAGRARAGEPGSAGGGAGAAAQEVADKIEPLDLAVSDRAPERINVLIPTIDLEHMFGGYIAKLNLALRLARRGARVRIVTVDPVGPLPHSWKQTLESYGGLTGLFDSVEIAFGRGNSLEVSPGDRFIASTWWTAHIAAAAAALLGGERFVYLIQEYEPFTFPMGTYAALAEESYGFPHFGLFSSELLREYFRLHAVGVYAGGADGDDASVSFQNAITDVPAPTADGLAGRPLRRLLFYARPEPHAARNMFELGVLALCRALDLGAFRAGWELNGIGTVRGARRIPLAGSATLTLIPRLGQQLYAETLRAHDVGLALMFTPHPSLVPLEMASAGMLAVTNSFENKTPEAMAAISPNVIAAPPTIDGIARALCDAAEAAGQVERRVQGSAVRWSRNWDESFDERLLARVEAALGRP
jgi:glycosyltransferase involved in cell wall biosynthesis